MMAQERVSQTLVPVAFREAEMNLKLRAHSADETSGTREQKEEAAVPAWEQNLMLLWINKKYFSLTSVTQRGGQCSKLPTKWGSKQWFSGLRNEGFLMKIQKQVTTSSRRISPKWMTGQQNGK